MKKSIFRWLGPAIFLLTCAGVVWFLHLFTIADENMTYINWDSSVQIMEDGSEVPFHTDEYNNMTDLSGTYRFTGQIPAGLPNGSLLFEVSGLSLTLQLNGTEIYRSSSASPQNLAFMPQATIPLTADTSGTLVMTCEILDSTGTMFPPLLRYIPMNMRETQMAALANRAAFPAGAAALALVLAVGLFFLKLTVRRTDWSLLALIGAAAGLISHQIGLEQGAYFLPNAVYSFLSRSEISLAVIGLLLLYLFLNKNQQFFRYLGIVSAWSAAALVLAYLLSMLREGDLYRYINNALSTLAYTGLYSNLTYWITLWLTVVCILISAYGTVRSFVRQQAELENLQLKNQLTVNSYHAIEEKMRESAAVRHEMKHNLIALDSLCVKKDYSGVHELLQTLLKQNAQQTRVHFTENVTINSILQDASVRAAKANIPFEAKVQVPKDLSIPEQDLCILLMNMLDNALDACLRIEDTQKRYIRFRCNSKNEFFAIHCENSFSGEVHRDKRGKIISIKENSCLHGFGLAQMSAIAEKYHSLLDISYEPNRSFHIKTALKLPDRSDT